MRIGITCYPTYGGSGVVATELGKKLAQMGHEIHFISYALPYRLNRYQANLYFHEVEVSKYPLFEYPPYSLSLASKMVEVIEFADLDILHVHYAIPHATSAFLAREMTSKKNFKFITTLHGTDITLIGADPSFFKTVKFSIEQSDGVTAVSDFLAQETKNTFKISNDIEVIHNFIPDDFMDVKATADLKTCFNTDGSFVLTHISNFRPLKRVYDLIPIIQKLVQKHRVTLLMVGDGPDRSQMERMCREMDLCQHIRFLGKQDNVADILSISDLFVLPSEHESFGLAALEALACGVPCVTSNAGGLTEVNLHGQTGYVADVGNTGQFADYISKLIMDPGLLKKFSDNGKKLSQERFGADQIVPHYLRYYKKVLNQ